MSPGAILTSRRRARALVLQSLYEADTTGHAVDQILERNLEYASLGGRGPEFVASLVRGVRGELGTLDRLVARFAPAWPVEQLPVVDRNVLRMAVFEILHPEETPPRAVINEAVELAKRFGSATSPRFVNGVLGSVLEWRRQSGYNGS